MAARSLVRPVTSRAVHLRIVPRISTIGESREVLRLISQFGEVEHFRSLKYDQIPNPNAALVIFRDEGAAKHCLQRSPLRFRMGKVTAPENSTSTSGNGFTDTNSRVFEIQSHPARANFRDQLNMSHYHGGFAVDTKSAAQQDLAKRVPYVGLSDINWKAIDKPWRFVEAQSEQHGSFKDSGPRQSLQEMHEKAG
jgi:hypothetical protein